jgi:hypothetical protein
MSTTFTQKTCPQCPGAKLRPSGLCTRGGHIITPDQLGKADRHGIPVTGGAR